MPGCEFLQTNRGFHPRDLYDPDADSEDGKPPECERDGCSGLQRDGYAGYCSMKCAMETVDEDTDNRASASNAQRDAARAAQEASQ